MEAGESIRSQLKEKYPWFLYSIREAARKVRSSRESNPMTKVAVP